MEFVLEKLILDSNSLILLTKCDVITEVSKLFELVLPAAVFDETASENLLDRFPDAAVIASMVEDGILKVSVPAEDRLPMPFAVHRGEKEALLLSLQGNRALLATDDGRAIKAARFLRIPFIISPKMVLRLAAQQLVSYSKARMSLEKLAKIGRYPPEIIAEALLSLLEVRDG